MKALMCHAFGPIDTLRVEDMRGGKLLLFTSPWNVDWATDHNPDLILSEFGNVAF